MGKGVRAPFCMSGTLLLGRRRRTRQNATRHLHGRRPRRALEPRHILRAIGHIKRFQPALHSLRRPLGRVVAHPSRPGVLGLSNLDLSPWQATLSSGKGVVLAPGESCNLALVVRLTTPQGPVELQR